MQREALEIDGDLDLTLPNELRNLPVAVRADLDKVLAGAFDSAAHARILLRTERYRGHFKARSVVLLEQAGHEICRRVVMQIGREIGNANALVRIGFTAPQRRMGRRILVRDMALGARQLIGRG